MFGNPKRETCSERNLRASPYLYFAALYYFSRRTTIPNSSFEQSFHTQSKNGTSHGPLNPESIILDSSLFVKMTS